MDVGDFDGLVGLDVGDADVGWFVGEAVGDIDGDWEGLEVGGKHDSPPLFLT